jgi:hypothetical protein
MGRWRGKWIALLAVPILLALGAGVLVYQRYRASPHGVNARHPPEVARIMQLLPEIPANATLDEIIALLGLPRDWDGGSVSSTHCCMYWEVAPGYRFELAFDPVPRDAKVHLEFREAGFAARNRPGFAAQEYHTVYPYRTWKGMVWE